MKKEEVTIKKNKESVVIEKEGMRYEVYFDKLTKYAVFVGQPKSGSLIVIPNPDDSNKSGKI